MEQPPSLIEQEKTTRPNYKIISHLLPSVICKLLNNTIILINLWWSRTQEILLMGMGVATFFSFTFGYLIIISLNTGLAYQISRKKSKPEKIGIFYQRALIVNFLICAITITPLLYISKRFILLFEHIDNETAVVISDYLFQLLPSIYCFAFFDTTQTFLQSQGHILAPLIVQIVSVFMHMFLINHIGAAWSKNFTDIFCCVAIYVYIITLETPLKSWVEWTMKCIKGWGTHLKFLEVIGLSTYLETLFFFIFSLTAFKVDQKYLVCHICFINIMQIIYLAFLGIKVGGLSKIGSKLKENDYQSTRKEAQMTIKIILGTGLTLILIIFVYKSEIVEFFIAGQKGRETFSSNYWILILTIALTSIQTAISSLVKALQRNFSVLKLNILSYFIGIISANVLCYYYGYGLDGIWFGWNLGIVVNFLCCFYYLNKKYQEFFLQQRRELKQMITNRKQQNTDDMANDDEENQKSIEMKVLSGDKDSRTNLMTEQQTRMFNKTSLGAISEAESVMEGSKKVLFDPKNKI